MYFSSRSRIACVESGVGPSQTEAIRKLEAINVVSTRETSGQA